MRLFILLSTLMSFVVLVLSFLCIFAGSKPSTLTNYYMVSLNTSDIGGLPIVGGLINGAAEQAGISQFYSIYILDYCEGSYTGADYHGMQASYCSPHLKRVPPGQALQRDLDNHGHDVSIETLGWDPDIDSKFGLLYDVLEAALGLYSGTIFFSFLVILLGAFAALRHHGRCLLIVASICAFVAFLCSAIASAASTAAIVKGTNIFNEFAGGTHIVANRGHKFMALTWAGTALALLSWLVVTIAICFPGTRDRRKRVSV